MSETQAEKRRFYRHPVNIPIRMHETRTRKYDQSSTVDVSEGGLCFLADRFMARGTYVDVAIPVGDQVFRINGQIAYCNRMPTVDRFRTGIAFSDSNQAFRAKLAEQMLQIKQYQKSISDETGEEVSEEEAARTWIEKNAKHFSYLF